MCSLRLALAVGRGRSSDARAGWGAIALMVIIFVSPLCALSSALFSARVLHHVLLIAAVAPLLALAFPQRRTGSRAARRAGRGACGHPVALACAGALCLGPRQRAGLLADAGLAAWKRLADVAGDPRAAAQPGPALVALAATIGQMGLLGAVIVFASGPLYLRFISRARRLGDSRRSPTSNWPGLLMWVPAMLPYLGVGLWIAWSSLRPSEPAL